MVNLNAHEAGNGGKKPREAYSAPSLLYSESVCLSRGRPQIRASSLPPVRMRVRIALRSEVQGEHAEQCAVQATNKQASKNRIFILPRAIC